jgi:hypothetical protein
VPHDAPIPSADNAPDAGAAFVLRCRRETQAEGPGRLHFNLQLVGAKESWRFTDLDRVFVTLRTEIDRLLGDDRVNETRN